MSLKLNNSEQENILQILQKRFEKNNIWNKKFKWSDIETKLIKNPQKIRSLNEMEKTGGEPDIIDYDPKTKEFIFCDCSAESPKGRRSLCYDNEALDSRKNFKPKNSAIQMAKEMGIELLDTEQYQKLQKTSDFDLKTSSWLKTPSEIRVLGGAIFGDKRYKTVFIYHNGAESYYASRGFRGLLRI